MRQEDDRENINRCSGHQAVPDSELHRLLRHRLKLPEPRESSALTDEEWGVLEREVSQCVHCQDRLGILERSEALRREEAERHLVEAAATAKITTERMAEIRAAYEEHLERAFTLRAQLTARPLSEESSNLGALGAEKLKQLRMAVKNDDQGKLVSLLSSENSSASSGPRLAWLSRTQLLLKSLLSEVRDSDDQETRKSLADAEELFLTRSLDLDRSPLDVSRFSGKKHFVCFLILLGYQTLLSLLIQSPEQRRMSAVGKPLSSENQLDLRPLFVPIARVSAASRRHHSITLRLPRS